MNPINIRRLLFIIGAVIIALGIAWPWLGKLGLGRLPGDITVRKGNFVFYIPIVTSLVISAILTVLVWFFRR